MEILDLDLSESNFRFLDKETNVELEISKLISEQERNNENPNYDDVDEEIARLIHNFEEEEKQRREQGKPSLIACASPLLSFLLEEKDEDLAVTNDRLGISQAMSREDLEANNLQKDIAKSKAAEIELDRKIKKGTNEIVLKQAAQGPTRDASKKTESAPLSLLKVRVSPTPKIVNRLSEIKKKNTRGPCKRLTRKTPKDLTADPPL